MKNKIKKLDSLKGIKIAHRGLWDKDNPENSVGAFKRCIDKGVPIEMDVRILGDGELVVFHDDNTFRMTGIDSLLRDTKYDDIRDLKLKGTRYNISRFEDVLKLVSGKVLLDIEIKNSGSGFKLCQEVSKYLDKYDGDFIVKSFNPLYVSWFRIFRPNYIRGLLISRLDGKNRNYFLKNMLFKINLNFIVKPDIIIFNYKNLPSTMLDRMRSKGILVWLYTLCENEINNYKYDGYIYEE